MPPIGHAIITRTFAVLSSITTGTVVGLVVAVIGSGLSKVIVRR
ncbi:hypothetical protein ACFSTA_07010 [Ornithinibacillus salinisoli]|uniref:Uncharacterized protein n=1 Tax=Ornithinibacillus salinisoli TaxID=1848459 RepID=A0ABW4VYM8_9BACI